MERREAIEHLIEAGREEAPRIVAERSREAVEAVEAGVAAALASARGRLRQEPSRPGLGRLVLASLLVAVAVTVLGFIAAALVERGQRWLRDRQAGGPDDAIAMEARRASAAVNPDDSVDDDEGPARTVAIPVASSKSPDDGARSEVGRPEAVSTA
jgi:hypothetical protein